MSTDDTQPVRPPSPAPGGPASNAPTEVRPSFQPAPRPAAQPSAPAAPPAQPSYQRPRSAEPSTVRIEQQPASPPPSSRQPAERGWPEQPPGQGGQYEAPGGYGSGQPATAPYGSQPGYGQSGAAPSGPGNYDPASYGQSGYGGQGGPQLPPGRARRKRKRSRRRRITMASFIVLVVLILLVIGDQVGKAVAENQIASQISSADAQIHPSISIKEGLSYPFLGQIVTRDIHEMDISASNVAAGPVTITSVSAVAKGIHINGSFNGGKVDSITATVFIGFSSLSNALSSQTSGIASLTLSSAGNGEVKASFGIAGASLLTETGKITLKGNQVSIVWVSSGSGGGSNDPLGGLIGGLAGGGSGGNGATLPNLSFTIPKLPAGVQITGFTVGTQGITIMGGAHNTTLSQ